MKYYAGIGSRKTPPDILTAMTRLAWSMNIRGYTLRSGGAAGADTAFEEAAALKEIFLGSDATPEAIEMAADYHPAWDRCNNYVRHLHGRNCMIILGAYLTIPVECVICWTPEGRITGGTGLGLRIAKDHNIPVQNLGATE